MANTVVKQEIASSQQENYIQNGCVGRENIMEHNKRHWRTIGEWTFQFKYQSVKENLYWQRTTGSGWMLECQNSSVSHRFQFALPVRSCHLFRKQSNKTHR